MKLPYYTATKGLERFPANERFTIYRNTHKRLLKEDTVYRKRRDAYVASTACVAIVPVLGINANGSFKIVFWVFTAITVFPMIIFFAFRQQNFMNQRIGEALQKTS